MEEIRPTPPPLLFGYWRPWNEGSDVFDSYLDYVKDTSLAKYSAAIVAKYVTQASREQVKAIGELRQQIGLGLNALAGQVARATVELHCVNRNLEMQAEQQRVTNLLLKDIAQLLRVPDTEKKRQKHIERGLKFFASAQQDQDLFDDALEELKMAEELMRQDYFVLHRIGLIYMHSLKHLDPRTALDYFARAAKYAAVECDPKAAQLANALANLGNQAGQRTSDSEAIKWLAAYSYEQAAFAAYVLGDWGLAVDYQTKAFNSGTSVENQFLLAKYQARAKHIGACLANIEKAIDERPSMALEVFKELDLLNEPDVLALIQRKNSIVEANLRQLIVEWENVRSQSAMTTVAQLHGLLSAPYDEKVRQFGVLSNARDDANAEFEKLKVKGAELKDAFLHGVFPSLTDKAIRRFVASLDSCLDQPLEVIREICRDLSTQCESHRLKLGAKFFGGTVFFIDRSGKHGLVMAETSAEECWGGEGAIGTKTDMGSGRSNTERIVQGASWYVQKRWLSTTRTPAPTAARVCLELNLGGFDDWFLPSKDEMDLINTVRGGAEKKRFDAFCSRIREEVSKGVYSEDYADEKRCNYKQVRYWSSSEADQERAWLWSDSEGCWYDVRRTSNAKVVAVRVF